MRKRTFVSKQRKMERKTNMDSRVLKISLLKAVRAVADLLMPRVCVVCGQNLLLCEEHICTECLADLPLTHFSKQRNNPMSEVINVLVQREIDAEDGVSESFVQAASLFYYSSESNYRNITRSLKYGRNFATGRFFSQMLGREMATSQLFADVDLCVPVPLHPTRLWQRGYNQAEIIAKSLVHELPNARFANLLKRVRRTKTQTQLTHSQRFANVKSAFVPVSVLASSFSTVSAPLTDSKGSVASSGSCFAATPTPKHVLLVDDVFTTGATVCACRRALRRLLPPETKISIATLGFVGK